MQCKVVDALLWEHHDNLTGTDMRHSKKQLPGVLALWAYFVPSRYRLALTMCTVAKRFGWIFVLSGDSFSRSHSQRSWANLYGGSYFDINPWWYLVT